MRREFDQDHHDRDHQGRQNLDRHFRFAQELRNWNIRHLDERPHRDEDPRYQHHAREMVDHLAQSLDVVQNLDAHQVVLDEWAHQNLRGVVHQDERHHRWA